MQQELRAKIKTPSYIYVFLLVFMTLGMTIGFIFGFNWNTELESTYNILKDWKELISAMIAILAAWIAWNSTRSQIDTQILIHEDYLEREAFASLAALNIALSDICAFAQINIEKLKKLPLSKIEEFPAERPTEAINIIIDNIKISKSGVVDALYALLTEIQIAEARFNETSWTIYGDYNKINEVKEDRIFDFIIIHARASSMFLYSRRKETHIRPINRDDLISAAEFMKLNDTDFGHLHKRILNFVPHPE